MDCYYNPVRTLIERGSLDQISDLIKDLEIEEKNSDSCLG